MRFTDHETGSYNIVHHPASHRGKQTNRIGDLATMSGGLTTDQKRALQRAAGDAIAYRDGLPDRPANPSMGVDAAIELFRKPLPDTGRSAEEVIAAMVRDAADGIHQMTAPSFFAYVCGASHPVGMAADMLVSAGLSSGTSTSRSHSV